MPDDRLKSGTIVTSESGVRMTVQYQSGDTVACIWFDENKVMHRENYKRGALTVGEKTDS
jgi:uncharacterized protein YodC (DUF2158 family)